MLEESYVRLNATLGAGGGMWIENGMYTRVIIVHNIVEGYSRDVLHISSELIVIFAVPQLGAGKAELSHSHMSIYVFSSSF